MAERKEITWIVLPGNRRSALHRLRYADAYPKRQHVSENRAKQTSETYKSHIIAKESTPALTISFPKEPYAVPLVLAQVGVDGARHHHTLRSIEDKRAQGNLTRGEWEVWARQKRLRRESEEGFHKNTLIDYIPTAPQNQTRPRSQFLIRLLLSPELNEAVR